MTPSRNKHIPSSALTPQDRKIRQAEQMDFKSKKASWGISRIDRNCQWGWDNLDSKGIWDDIHSKLKSFESMNWASIMQGGSHLVKFADLIPEAQKRLTYLHLDDLDSLFSLRLTGHKRIWGDLDNGILFILWYDPDHGICPSLK
jgi:hypothetical protein